MVFKKKRRESLSEEKVAEENIKFDSESIEKKNLCVFETLRTVNELLQFMTELSYVKEMIKDATEQSEMVGIVASSSEEISATTEDISDFVQITNDAMDETVRETGIKLNLVDETFGIIENNINETNVVKEIIAEVANETGKINELVNVIKSVADQTNMLSLNASIEAARAGENGRGFAVVANEIKKLAENTKEQVDIIRNIVDGLNGKIEKASSEIDKVVSTFNNSKTSINEATSGIKGINETLGLVVSNFSSISSSIEEQTATIEEISSSIQNINEKSVNLRMESEKTGEAFFDISEKVDKIRIQALNCSENMDSDMIIDLGITDHLMWKWRVYNMILGHIELDVKDVGNHKECRLGKWLTTLDKNDANIKNLLDKIENPHSNIHTLAKKAIEEYKKGDILAAENVLIELEENSKFVISDLIKLKKLI